VEETVMQKVVIEIPDEFAQEISPYRDRLKELMLLGLLQFKTQEALLLYSRGLVSFARAAELAGMDRPAFIRQARAFGVKPRWSEQMVQEELA
jgi:predicted HTH domain antitoxin